MIRLTIDGREAVGRAGQTILDIAIANDIDIPALCHEPRLKTYAACGICVVEVEGISNLVRACATEARDGMVIYSESDRVKSSRKLTLELLLSDHCGDCRPPCSLACPAGTDCQGYVGLIANGHYREAVQLLKESYPLPASIGLVCPHPCEDACRRGRVDEPIAIANLKAFVGMQDLTAAMPYQPPVQPASGKKVAVVGAGPAGLTAAFFLARAGNQVTVFDAMPQAGGMLRYGIPEYRLPKEILEREIQLIKALGVSFINNVRLGRDIHLDVLRQEHDAVFLATGAWQSSRIGCPGEEAEGVLGGIDFLREVAQQCPVALGDRVAVIGGGNTAMDAARTALRLGAGQVMVLYRRTRAEMPAQDSEIEEAMEEGVQFHFLAAPQEIVSNNGKAAAVKVDKMKLGEPDASGRRRPVPTGEEELISVDTVIAAIGQEVNTAGLEDLALSRWDTIDADEQTCTTSMAGVFAGGDVVSGPGIAIEAVAWGKKAAESIQAYLQGETVRDHSSSYLSRQEPQQSWFDSFAQQPRCQQEHADPEVRRHNFAPVSHILPTEKALAEAGRCLECGCLDYFECKLLAYARRYGVQPERLRGGKHPAGMDDSHPFMVRDMGKCILCGLCVRVCEEIAGVSALGLVDRGFATVITPEMGVAWKDSGCISCGECVALCPTGALSERIPGVKPVPLQLSGAAGFCTGCGIACDSRVEKFGSRPVRVMPASDGLLCSRGRFGWKTPTDRLEKPLLRRESKFGEISFAEAGRFLQECREAITRQHGEAGTAFYLTPSCSGEEAQQLANLAAGFSKTTWLGSFSRDAALGLEPVIGHSQSTASWEDLYQADLIMLVGDFDLSQVALMRTRMAVEKGARLVVISPDDNVLEDCAWMRVQPAGNATDWLEGVLAAVLKHSPAARDACNGEKGLAASDISFAGRDFDHIQERIAEEMVGAKHAIMVVDGYMVSTAAVQVLANLAALTGHLKGAGGLLIIGPGGNRPGITKAGFVNSTAELVQCIHAGQCRAVFILGEDPIGAGLLDGKVLRQVDLLVVAAPCMHATAELADLVIPMPAPGERYGHYLTAAGEWKLLDSVIPGSLTTPSGILHRLLVHDSAQKQVLQFPESYTQPVNREERANLVLPDPAPIFLPSVETDAAQRLFLADISARGCK